MKRSAMTAAMAAITLTGGAMAQDGQFTKGPVFTDYGAVTQVQSDLPIPPGTVFKVVLNVTSAAKPGEVNRGFDSAARFINMNVAAGVPEKNIHVAIVVHGSAPGDLLIDTLYGPANGGAQNANEPLVKALLAHGVQIYVCGQSLGKMGRVKGDLLPGVKVALSAMDAHALLAQQGYVQLP